MARSSTQYPAGGHRGDLAPFPSEQMQAHDVSALVNKPEYDGAECIQPAPHPQGRLL